ncbi:D-arabinono-1,4-lactone oxidase [Pseudonocardia abyssalis]|uniref:FAD-binding protein n=1 Tax=Pseudonocardia abyssalis TaxID=2792008 RepID=A0ABS6V0D9_9PSEU|nr:D-arabinono-1,4-lactone oxidase [Pseudonocardia abyssalis]MBW0115116.1 FAD-binding protein [Pseudonocardia abyssalis]MBW0137955.1 FAD-binding protein [Pseudonocardia abyssalis]
MWRNWAGNQRADPVRTVVARDAGDVVDAVRAARHDGLRVTALGSGHSFTAIGAPLGVAVRAPAAPAAVRVDGDLVTVPAGLSLHALNALLWDRGRALPNLGDIDVQTVAGAISTGTHGTGAAHRGIAAQVRALDLVTADGTLLQLSPSSHPDVFSAARVGLGALGVLVGVTLATVPAFRLRAVERVEPLAAVLGDLDAFLTSAEHVEFYWFPHSGTAATKRNDPVAPGPDRGRVARWVGDEVLGNAGFGAVCRLGRAAPVLVPRLNRFVAGRMAAGEYVDRSYRVFTSPRRVRFLEMEYAVPRAALREAFDGMRAAAARHARVVPFPVEVRVAAADDVPLSTACGRDSAYVAVHVHRGQPHEAYFGAVEDVMTALGGRPHWGKLHTRTADDLRPLYPGFDAFTALRDRLDPDRRFTNPYLDRVLG